MAFSSAKQYSSRPITFHSSGFNEPEYHKLNSRPDSEFHVSRSSTQFDYYHSMPSTRRDRRGTRSAHRCKYSRLSEWDGISRPSLPVLPIISQLRSGLLGSSRGGGRGWRSNHERWGWRQHSAHRWLIGGSGGGDSSVGVVYFWDYLGYGPIDNNDEEEAPWR